MDGKIYVGKRVDSFDQYTESQPITGVALIVDDDNEYRAGNDEGLFLEATCPYATQAMANNLLAALQGKQYRGYEATAAKLPLTAELGDGVTVGGIYSMLAYQETHFGPEHRSDIAAPSENEVDHEYPYIGQTVREARRQKAEVKSLIAKSASEIMLQVEGVDGRVSTLTQNLDGLTSRVEGIGGDVSTLTQTVSGISTSVSTMSGQISTLDQRFDSIKLKVSNGSNSSTLTLSADGITAQSATIQFTGVVTFSDLESNSKTKINGDYITTGTIDAVDIAGRKFYNSNKDTWIEIAQGDGWGLTLNNKNYQSGTNRLFGIYDGTNSIGLYSKGHAYMAFAAFTSGVSNSKNNYMVECSGDWKFRTTSAVDFQGNVTFSGNTYGLTSTAVFG